MMQVSDDKADAVGSEGVDVPDLLGLVITDLSVATFLILFIYLIQ